MLPLVDQLSKLFVAMAQGNALFHMDELNRIDSITSPTGISATGMSALSKALIDIHNLHRMTSDSLKHTCLQALVPITMQAALDQLSRQVQELSTLLGGEKIIMPFSDDDAHSMNSSGASSQHHEPRRLVSTSASESSALGSFADLSGDDLKKVQ